MTKSAARALAQAKLNLHLRVFPRDATGYHPLETIFARLALGDIITVRISSTRQTVDVVGDRSFVRATGPMEQNLAFRAALAYTDHAAWPPGFEVTIDKRIPVGSGLGGGSADAAAVLLALNELAPRRLDSSEILGLAATLGSDVPFMASGFPAAIGRGRGDELTPIDLGEERPVLLVTPSFSIPTADAYAWFAADSGELKAGERTVPGPTWDSLAAHRANDLEAPVASRHPEIAEIIEAVRAGGARVAGMTGSGSTVFGVYDPGEQPALPRARSDWQVRVTHTLRSVVQPTPID